MDAEHAEEQGWNTHVLVEEVHSKMFSSQESAAQRGRRALREEIAYMTPEELSAFAAACQQEFHVPQPAVTPAVTQPVKRARVLADKKADIYPSLASLQKKWAEEDEASTTASTP